MHTSPVLTEDPCQRQSRDGASPAAETQRRSRENSKREIEALEEIEAFMVTLGVLALTRHLHAAAPLQNAHDLLYLL
jgi:hypothetical protein